MDTINFISSLRQQALLLSDYNAYRQMCSRRLAKLRKRLGRVSDPTRKDSRPAPVTAEDLAKDPTYAHLLLYSSERAWAHAMHMKSFSSDSAESTSRAMRDHIRSRLAKAASHAASLRDLYSDPASTATDTDVVEAAAYAASLEGAVAFEKTHWEDTLQKFAISKISYDALAVGVEKKGELYKEFLTSNVEPSIRYAAYQMGIPRTTDIAQLARQFFPKEGRHAQTGLATRIEKLNVKSFRADVGGEEMEGVEQTIAINTVAWRGRKAAVEDDNIAVALGTAQKVEEDLRKLTTTMDRKISAEDFDGLLLSWQDCVDETKKAIDKAVTEGVSTADPKLQKLHLIYTYVNYNLISWRIGRNRFMVEDIEAKLKQVTSVELGKLKELVVLYNAILQSVDQVTELPGVAADEEFCKELEAKRGFFAALRCAAIAPSHIEHNSRNTLALYYRALTYLSSSIPSLRSPAKDSTETIRNLNISLQEATSLKQEVEAQVTRHRGLIQLQDYVAKAAKNAPSAHAPLIDTLEAYNGKVDFSNLVPLPPKVEPVPVKPIFFDIAWNFVEYPQQQRKEVTVQEPAKAQEATPKKGGFLGGLFGR
ncbi:hypothetical protein BDZ91DRAFT_672115 [Kalaharituber pfeilii]|nr:hypothetical protein BDZ91DRAFT_672115 [Kalaharituber pfeilii]